MKLQRILFLAAAIVIPLLALAELPFSKDAFGRIEGTYDFCAQANPEAKAKYAERKKRMVGDVPEKELTEARGSKEYIDAYEGIGAQLAEVPKDQAVQACKAALEEK